MNQSNKVFSVLFYYCLIITIIVYDYDVVIIAPSSAIQYIYNMMRITYGPVFHKVHSVWWIEIQNKSLLGEYSAVVYNIEYGVECSFLISH